MRPLLGFHRGPRLVVAPLDAILELLLVQRDTGQRFTNHGTAGGAHEPEHGNGYGAERWSAPSGDWVHRSYLRPKGQYSLW